MFLVEGKKTISFAFCTSIKETNIVAARHIKGTRCERVRRNEFFEEHMF